MKVFFILCSFLGLSLALTPVIVLPGFGGSNLEAKLVNAHPPSIFCKKNSEPYQVGTISFRIYPNNIDIKVWINILQDVRYLHIDCLEYILELSWDNKTKKSYDNEGVTIIPKDFGGCDGCSCLDKNFCEFSHYFYNLFNSLQKAGVNVLAATYDFRLSPQQLINDGKYLQNLKSLVEDTYEKNDGKSVALVCHSMGCSLSSVFLGSYVTEDWKQKYVDKWIPLSGVFDGSVESFGYMVVGITPVLPSWLDWKIFGQTLQKYIARLARKTSNWPALQWMIPKYTIKSSDVILSTDLRNYTFNQYNQMLDDAGFGYIYDIYESVNLLEKRYSGKYDSVSIHCVYAENTETPVSFYVDNITSPTVGKITKSVPGDGIVTLEALELCDSLNDHVEVLRLKNSEHQALVSDSRTVDYIIKLVS